MDTLSPDQDKFYTIGDSALIWSILFSSIKTTQVPACGYTQTYSSSTPHASMTYSLSSVSIDYYALSTNDIDA